jgi:hypothetical protein
MRMIRERQCILLEPGIIDEVRSHGLSLTGVPQGPAKVHEFHHPTNRTYRPKRASPANRACLSLAIAAERAGTTLLIIDLDPQATVATGRSAQGIIVDAPARQPDERDRLHGRSSTSFAETN